MKYRVTVKEGRGYLHMESEQDPGLIGYAGIIPLGDDPQMIAEIAKEHNVGVEFLQDEGGEE